MSPLLKRIGFAFLICLLACSLYSQEEILYLNRLSTQNGLTANNYNYHVSKDSRGFAWISSFSGLIRFDGIEARVYLPDDNDSLSLADPDIWSIVVEDSQKRLWFNSATSVHYFEPDKQTFHRVPIEWGGMRFVENRVLYFEEQRNTLWFLSDKGVSGDYFPLFQMHVDSPGTVHSVDSIPHYWPYGVQLFNYAKNGSHYLLLPQSEGWEIREYREREQISVRTFPKVRSEDRKVFSFYPESDGTLWVGTLAGLIRTDLDGTSWRTPDCFQGQCIQDIRGIVPYDSSTLLIATEKSGLYLFDIPQFRYTHRISFVEAGYVLPFQEAILRMYLDNDRNLWICTRAQGIYFTNLDKKRFRSHLLRRLNMRENNNVRTLTEDREGNIWSATEKGLILVDKDGKNLPPTKLIRDFNEHTQGVNLYHITCDTKGNIWVSSNAGLFVLPFGKNRYIKLTEEKGPGDSPSPVFTYLYELEDGTLLASTYGKGIYEVKNSGDHYSLVRPSPAIDNGGPHKAMFEDSANRLFTVRIREWIRVFSTESGPRKHLQDIRFPAEVHGFAEDPDTTWIWIGSSRGLYRLEWQQDTFRRVRDSVFSSRFPVVNGLMFDEEGLLWVSTPKGLVQYKPFKEQNLQADGKQDYRLREFGVADGLQDSEFNYLSFTKTDDNKLAFGGINGFTLFDPKDIPPFTLRVRPTITQILINEKPLEESDEAKLETSEERGTRRLVLKPSVRTFRFNFASMEFGYSGTRQFAYKLKQKNGRLIDSGSENFASYINLDAGNYTFELNAFNSESVRSPDPLLLEIRVQPHWSETWWFYSLLLLAFLGVVYAIYRNRLDLARKKQQLAELETAILRVQMNPHFIFNSLNSILSYIREKDLETADEFLMYFARLMRNILDRTERPYLSLYEERELLEEYMKIEALRFEHAFSYQFEIPDSLDMDEVVIPTMILQPFIENSIIHGFRGKKDAGRITIRFSVEGGSLRCSIRDNGMGRKAAGNALKKHDSKALKITRKRLKLLEEQTGKPTALEILDHSDSQGKSSGTEVRLTLPLL